MRQRGRLTAALGMAALLAAATTLTASAGRPAGPGFDLVDAEGNAWSSASFPADAVLLVYFGYTTCLQACPTALDAMAAAVEQLGDATPVRPVFVDMDPERAARLSLPLYMDSFGTGFLGLTGSEKAVADAAARFGVTVRRLSFSADPGDYTMTHVSPIFVMRPGDAPPVALDPASPPEAIAAAVVRLRDAAAAG